MAEGGKLAVKGEKRNPNFTGKNTPTPSPSDPYPGTGRPIHHIDEATKAQYDKKDAMNPNLQKKPAAPAVTTPKA